MGAHGNAGERPGEHAGPDMVAPTTKVNVALPFGSIHVEESSTDLTELARIVAELAALVEEAAPTEASGQLAEQARALSARLR
jgi:hypothetical protein